MSAAWNHPSSNHNFAMTERSPHDQNPAKGDRRSHQRHYVRGRAVVLLPPARSFKAEAVDISEGGVCLTSPVEVTPGTWCHLRINLLASTGPDISISGQVCFCVEFNGVYRVGVHCLEAQALVDAVRDRDP